MKKFTICLFVVMIAINGTYDVFAMKKGKAPQKSQKKSKKEEENIDILLEKMTIDNKKQEQLAKKKQQEQQEKEQQIQKKIEQKRIAQERKAQQRKEEIFKQFRLADMFDSLPTTKKEYKIKLIQARDLILLLEPYFDYVYEYLDHLKRLEALYATREDLPEETRGTEEEHIDSLIINQRLRTIDEYFRMKDSLSDEAMSYDPFPTMEFLNGIIANENLPAVIRDKAKIKLFKCKVFLACKMFRSAMDQRKASQIKAAEKMDHLLPLIPGKLANMVLNLQKNIKNILHEKNPELARANVDNTKDQTQELLLYIVNEIRELKTESSRVVEKSQPHEPLASSDIALEQTTCKAELGGDIEESAYSKFAESEPIARLSYSEALRTVALHQHPIISVTDLQSDFQIKGYLNETVMDWFNDPQKAVEREVRLYPNTNRTVQQRLINEAAHTFPWVIDSFINTLAYRFPQEDGSVLYIIPGLLYIAEMKLEQIGYYSWVVSKNGIVVHRSFTIKDYGSDANLAEEDLYSKTELSEQLLKEGTTGHPPRVGVDYTITTNGLTLIVTDNSTGNVYKLMLKPK